jgi:hypothetical protein
MEAVDALFEEKLLIKEDDAGVEIEDKVIEEESEGIDTLVEE